MVLVEGYWNLGVHFRRRQHQVVEEAVVRVLAGSARSLDYDRRARLTGGLHDRLYLLQIVDVERAYAVAAFGSLVE